MSLILVAMSQGTHDPQQEVFSSPIARSRGSAAARAKRSCREAKRRNEASGGQGTRSLPKVLAGPQSELAFRLAERVIVVDVQGDSRALRRIWCALVALIVPNKSYI